MNKSVFIIPLSLFLAANVLFSQDKKTGLIFDDPEKLKGVPIASTPYSGDEFPNFVDLSENMPPPGNQGGQNSCVAWSVAYAIKSYEEKVEERVSYYNGSSVDYTRIFSPAFVYNQINLGRDGGSSFIFALNVLTEQGCATLADLPYNEGDYLSLPSDEVKLKAKKYKIDFWRQVDVNDLQAIKAQLNAGYPVMIGAKIDKSFEQMGHTNQDKPLIWESNDGSTTYGHAMVVVGFSDELAAFKVLNSWGTSWGNGGYFWISYSFFPKCIYEAFVAKDARNKKDEISANLSKDELLLTEGKDALDKDEYSVAITKLSDYLKSNQTSDNAHTLLGLAYFKSGNYSNALTEYQSAIKINPKNTEALNNLALVNYKSGDYAGSIDSYSKVLKLDPNYAECYFYRGLAYKKTGKFSDAVKDFAVAIDFKPDNHNIYYHRGLCYYELKDYAKAEQDFSMSIKYNSNISQFYLKRGFANYKLKNFDKAIEDYQKAVEVNPENFDANKELGLSLYKNYKYQESINYLSKAISIDGNDVICYYVRGLCYYFLTDHKNAVADWEKAISINPDIEKEVKEKLETSRGILKK